MKTLIILRGLPGSGKSTLAELFKSLGYHHFEADMYFMYDNGYRFNINELNHAHKWCKDSVKLSMSFGANIVVSNTFTTEKELKPYMELAEQYEYTVHSIIKENRHSGESIHLVPQETIEKMKQRFTINL